MFGMQACVDPRWFALVLKYTSISSAERLNTAKHLVSDVVREDGEAPFNTGRRPCKLRSTIYICGRRYRRGWTSFEFTGVGAASLYWAKNGIVTKCNLLILFKLRFVTISMSSG